MKKLLFAVVALLMVVQLGAQSKAVADAMTRLKLRPRTLKKPISLQLGLNWQMHTLHVLMLLHRVFFRAHLRCR